MTTVFDDIEWGEGRFLLRDAVFSTDPFGSVTANHVDVDSFTLFKGPPFIELYRTFFDSVPLRPERILELGLWHGGSLAFWAGLFNPEKIVGIDGATRGDSPYFRNWIASRGLGDRVRTHWGVDQGDGATLRRIVAEEFRGAPLDLVIDDCSHMFVPTKASFEALFPCLRVGGFYIIEDWNLASSKIVDPSGELHLVDFVESLVRAAADTERGLVRSLTLNGAFVAVQRGSVAIDDAAVFDLDDFTCIG